MPSKQHISDYRTLSTELETVLRKLEGDDLSIDEAIKAYEEGVALVKQIETHLAQAENHISKLRLSATAEKGE